MICTPHHIFSGTIKLRRMIWAGRMVRIGYRSAYGVSVGKSEGKRPLLTPEPIWEDNIEMYLQEV